MERLIAVRFRARYPITSALWHYRVKVGDKLVNKPALGALGDTRTRGKYNTHSHNIIHLLKGDVLLLHLSVDGAYGFGPTSNLRH